MCPRGQQVDFICSISLFTLLPKTVSIFSPVPVIRHGSKVSPASIPKHLDPKSLFQTWLRIKDDHHVWDVVCLGQLIQTSSCHHQVHYWFAVKSLIWCSYLLADKSFGVNLSTESRWSVPTYTNNYTSLNVLEMTRWGGKGCCTSEILGFITPWAEFIT